MVSPIDIIYVVQVKTSVHWRRVGVKFFPIKPCVRLLEPAWIMPDDAIDE